MLTVSWGRRIIGTLLNIVTVYGLIFGSAYLMFKKGQTFGGMIMGYKYQGKGVGLMMRVWGGTFVAGFLYSITFGIFLVFDIIKMKKRNGWSWEEWFNCKKTNSK